MAICNNPPKAKPFRRAGGFSLIELLVVISIMAVLAAIVMPNFMGARERAKDAQRINDLSSLKGALRTYYNDNQAYPTGTATMLGAGMTGYMSSILDLGFTYSYYQTASGDGFHLCLNLESGQGNDDIDSQTKCGSRTQSICGLGIGVTADKLFVVCAN